MVQKNIYLSEPRLAFVRKIADGMTKINPKLREDRKEGTAIQFFIDQCIKIGQKQLLIVYEAQVNKKNGKESSNVQRKN
jgi:hypothetical protein